MSHEPTWADLLAREPRRGDLLAEVRAFRGDPETFWQPGGIADRLARTLNALPWPDPTERADAHSTALEILWLALPAHRQKGDIVDVDPETLTPAQRIARINRLAMEHAEHFHNAAEEARQGVAQSINGIPVTPEFLDALARFAAVGWDTPAAEVAAACAGFERELDAQEWEREP